MGDGAAAIPSSSPISDGPSETWRHFKRRLRRLNGRPVVALGCSPASMNAVPQWTARLQAAEVMPLVVPIATVTQARTWLQQLWAPAPADAFDVNAAMLRRSQLAMRQCMGLQLNDQVPFENVAVGGRIQTRQSEQRSNGIYGYFRCLPPLKTTYSEDHLSHHPVLNTV
ncbi:hypothetical protein CXG81DRAFT_24612 [Caulochytrium protostelioides]|uniref:Uncharacterized protein n=1 Tax=Caulochytrium protostelioides TaxID=1555241 RepID=A0A4P9XBH6_9FUNG|nr:hypothetical protein CXG81DRAFT_24612 [Caulochytrium protostelioides]|eukprot:RKP02732.1 hypothetical protein CXG81DRAFT_24612 [Caulochytrium protostelioides]